MSTTILTKPQILSIMAQHINHDNDDMRVKPEPFARAIEQAVLQSDEIQELREALSLVLDLAAQEWMDQNGKRMAAAGNDGNRFWFITEDVMSAVRAAMEKQP